MLENYELCGGNELHHSVIDYSLITACPGVYSF